MVVVSKYGLQDGWNPRDVRDLYERSPWKGIMWRFHVFEKFLVLETEMAGAFPFGRTLWCGNML